MRRAPTRCRAGPEQGSEAVASVAVDRLLGLLSILVIALIGIALAGSQMAENSVGVFAAGRGRARGRHDGHAVRGLVDPDRAAGRLASIRHRRARAACRRCARRLSRTSIGDRGGLDPVDWRTAACVFCRRTCWV